jgi:hypothetical protein
MSTDLLSRVSAQFLADGYAVLPLDGTVALDEARDALVDALCRVLGRADAALDTYHDHALDPRVHETVLETLTDELRKGGHARRIVESQLALFTRLIGPDLCVQRQPYLRIARPGVEADNVDYHRDTHYGRSPFEVSVWIPFVDVPPEMALRVLPGSHVAPEAEYPTTQVKREDVQRGSLKHRLGFPYAPKRMLGDVEKYMRPVPVQYGEILIFSLSIVHGQRVNTSGRARFSCDTRVAHGLAPIAWEASVSGRYYETLSRSAVSEQARRYAVANGLATNLDEWTPRDG